MSTFEKPPKSERTQPRTKGQALGEVHRVRVHDLPIWRKKGLSKKRDFEERGYVVTNVVDEEGGVFDMEIPMADKRLLDREDYKNARGHYPDEAPSRRTVHRKGKDSIVEAASVTDTKGSDLFNEVPDDDNG